MTALGAFALTSAEATFFPPPPHRPDRPERRRKEGAGIARTVIRAFRNELAHALDDADADPIRVTTNYPY